jgi:ferredoxin
MTAPELKRLAARLVGGLERGVIRRLLANQGRVTASPPTRPTRRCRRCVVICPSGANAFDRRPSGRIRKRFQPQNRLRLKTNFNRAFKSMTPVQICCEKYSALRSAKVSRIFLASRLVQRGVSRSSRTWRRAAVDARDRSILLNADERSLRGRPSRVVLAPRRWR